MGTCLSATWRFESPQPILKVFFLNHNHILDDVMKSFEPSPIERAERVVSWNEVLGEGAAVINYAVRRGIPSIVVQHGRSGSSRYYPPFNQKIVADKLLVFGEKDRRDLIAAGQDGNKIKVVGTTLFSHLKPRARHRGINIVFSPDHWDTEIDENAQTAKELRKLKNVKIITKLVDGNDPSYYDNPVFSNRDAADHMEKVADVLSIADVVVGISEGTFELLAQSLDIPVVIMGEWTPKSFGGDPRYKDNYRRIISKASKKATLKTLCQEVKNQIRNPAELRKERSETVIDEGGYNLDSLSLITNEIIRGKK